MLKLVSETISLQVAISEHNDYSAVDFDIRGKGKKERDLSRR